VEPTARLTSSGLGLTSSTMAGINQSPAIDSNIDRLHRQPAIDIPAHYGPGREMGTE
jgi:hypothetical protein